MSDWRPALRIGSRSILRSRGRSLLIVALVGLPVAAATYADVIAHTFSSPELTAQHMVGSADGALTITAQRRLPGYEPRWLLGQGPEPAPQRDPATVDLRPLLPRGSRLAPMPRYQPVDLRFGHQIVHTRILLGDVRQPLQRFLLRLSAGSRVPQPGEVVVTRTLAGRLHLLDGDRLRHGAAVTLVDGLRAPVAGLVRDPSCLSCEQIVALPGSAIARAARSRTPLAGYAYESPNGSPVTTPTYLVDLPAGTDEDALGRELATHGVALTTREALIHAGPRQRSNSPLNTGALVALISALGLLEVVLLAGAAFAVGARRQVRELGLVAAIGGSERDIRRIVLAQGLVLSASGAVLGIAAGAVIAVAGRSLWEQLANTEIAGWAFSPAEIAAAALVGTISGVAAAVIPAVGAGRMPPVDALAARFRAGARSGHGQALAGSGFVATGVVCCLLANHLLGSGLRGLRADAAIGGDHRPRHLTPDAWRSEPPDRRRGRAPDDRGRTARTAHRRLGRRCGLASTPVGPTRGARCRAPPPPNRSRHQRDRHRRDRIDRARVHPRRELPRRGDARATIASAAHPRRPAARAVHANAPCGRRTGCSTAARRSAPRGADPVVPEHKPVLGLEDESGSALSVVRQDRSCPAHLPAGVCSPIAIAPGGPLAIGGDDAVSRLVAGRGLDRAALQALHAGSVLVFDATMLDRGHHVEVDTPGGEVRLPGRLIPVDRTYGLFPAGLVSAGTAHAHGWDVGPGLVLVTYSAHASSDDVDAALTAAHQAGASGIRNTGPNKPVTLVLALLAAAAAFVTLAGAALSVALSVAESQADFATLAAVGAQPRRRRALAANQALLVAGIGSALGVGLGTFIGYTAHRLTGAASFIVPWAEVAATGVAVPALAALVAALCTRGALPMVRRLE